MRSQLLATLVVLAGLATPAFAGLDWAQPGGDPGRSGAQPTDPGEPPVGLVWEGFDADVRTPPVITPGQPGSQRVLYGVASASGAAAVVIRALAKPGQPIGPPAGVIVGDASGPAAFGPSTPNAVGAVGVVSTAPTAYAVHNEGTPTLRVEIARIALSNGSTDAPAEAVLDGSAGCTAETSPLLALGAIWVTTGGPGDCSALWKVPLAPDGTVGNEVRFVLPDLNAQAPPVLATLRDASGTRQPFVGVAAGNALRFIRAVGDPAVAITATLPAGEVAQAPLVPLGAGPDAIGPVFVASNAAGATRIHRFTQASNAATLTAAGSSAPFGGAPAPAMAAQPQDAGGAVLAVTAADGMYLVSQSALSAAKAAPAAAFSRTFPAIAGSLAFVVADDGKRFVVRLPAGTALGNQEFDGAEHDAPSAAWGSPALARGYAVFVAATGVETFRTRDVTVPTIALIGPEADSGLAGTRTFSARAADARGISQVEFRLAAPGGVPRALGSDTEADSGVASDPAVGGVFSADIQTGSVPNGTYVLDAVATDLSGLRTVSGRWTVRVVNAGGGVLGLKPGRCANQLIGGAGPDRLVGTAAGDLLRGGAGDDVLAGAGAADCLFGDDGKDRLQGGAGDDELRGDLGDDRLEGNNGRDRLNGGGGADLLRGGADNDVLTGGADRDDLRGGTGNDRLTGGAGNDVLRGEAGNDRLSGGAGNDRLIAGGGSNGIEGGAGDDIVSAVNRRRDAISCGSGRDRVRADRRDRVARNCERVARIRIARAR